MDFSLNERETGFSKRVKHFIDTHVRPRRAEYNAEVEAGDRWLPTDIVEALKKKARQEGLWNLFMPPHGGNETADSSLAFEGPQLTNVEYALCAFEMGKVHWSSEVFNCSPPDTGNMEVLHRYGSRAQKERWMIPLMEAEIRSAFLMTEPEVASSDATNVQTSIVRDGDCWVVNGRKWWSTGVGDPRCAVLIVMGKTDHDAPRHLQQTQVLVPIETPGVVVERMLPVYGYDHAPKGHGVVLLKDVRVPLENVILGEGRGFEIAQGRLGPGRIHHCMRAIGVAEEAIDAMAARLTSRVAFGRSLSEQSVWEERVAHARINIEMTSLLCLKAADTMDRLGNKAAQVDVAMAKVQTPKMALQILDDAVQAHGGAGVSDDFGLANAWANMRTLRIVDGPDEVHNRTIARAEFRKHK